MSYRFTKLYIDAIAEDGAVAIIYFTTSRLAGIIASQTMIELYEPDGASESVRGRVDVASLEYDRVVYENFIRLILPGGYAEIWMKPVHEAWKPGGALLSQDVDWSVNAAAIEISIEIIREGRRQALNGRGYADLTELSRIPRRLGIRQLDWGRIHWPDATVVFDEVRFVDGRLWKRLGRWSAEGFTETQYFNLEMGDAAPRLKLSDRFLNFDTLRVLHAGPALDAARFPNPFERLLIRSTSGRIAETRWLSRVYDPLLLAPGMAIHEHVVFGEAAFPALNQFSTSVQESARVHI